MGSDPAAIRGLVKKARERDPDAFGKLYNEYIDQIFRYVYYKVGDFQEAQDIAGQTFLKALENLDSYEVRDVAFSSWLFRIAHNLVVDHFRRESKRESVPIEAEAQSNLGSVSPTDSIFEELDSDRLYAAIQKLTHNQQEVLILKFIDNLPTNQVAEIMGISPGAVKSTQRRALQTLNRILGAR